MKFNHQSQALKIIIIITILLFILSNSKIVRRTITLSELKNEKSIFITRFDFGTGQNNITIKYKKLQADNSQLMSTRVGLLIDQNYNQYKNAQTCEQKQQLFKQTNGIRFYDSLHGSQVVRVNQNVREHLWFVYIYNCEGVPLRGGDGSEGIQLDFILMNDGSHLGEDQKLFWPYIILIVLWLAALIKKLFMPMLKSLIEPTTQIPKIVLLFAYLLLGLAVFYRLINIITTHYSGETIVVFDMLHGAFKNFAQGTVITLLVSISWGWTLTYLNYQTKYKIAAVSVTLLNVICVILWHYGQELQDSYHQYQEPAGILVFIIRIVICVIFVLGCLSIAAVSVGKRKYFIQKLLRYGSLYLFAWPAAVVICELFIPKYMHNEIITIIQEYSHLLAIVYMSWTYIHPDSEYQKINIKQEDKNQLPEYKQRR